VTNFTLEPEERALVTIASTGLTEKITLLAENFSVNIPLQQTIRNITIFGEDFTLRNNIVPISGAEVVEFIDDKTLQTHKSNEEGKFVQQNSQK